ncbi:MAG: DUF2911 domain-containing protein [Bacteroidetes bacterium]|nr:DUF2911 domain-containing protein [Bacteroidota bacterium]
MHRIKTTTLFFVLLLIGADYAYAQRPASPRGEASTQIGEAWIIVDYGRPILRGRTGIFGSGEEYGTTVTGPAPVWRAGANKSTRLHTEVPLMIGGTEIPAGEYSVFVELDQGDWTLILSTHEAKESGRAPGDGLWGSYNYTPDKDVVRAAMMVEDVGFSIDQFTISFFDVTETGGTLAMAWESTMATIPFTVVQ